MISAPLAMASSAMAEKTFVGMSEARSMTSSSGALDSVSCAVGTTIGR